MLKSTEHFMEKLKEFNPNSKLNMVSFDVVSLFTNIPLAETIDIIISHLYDKTLILLPFPYQKIFLRN